MPVTPLSDIAAAFAAALAFETAFAAATLGNSFGGGPGTVLPLPLAFPNSLDLLFPLPLPLSWVSPSPKPPFASGVPVSVIGDATMGAARTAVGSATQASTPGSKPCKRPAAYLAAASALPSSCPGSSRWRVGAGVGSSAVPGSPAKAVDTWPATESPAGIAGAAVFSRPPPASAKTLAISTAQAPMNSNMTSSRDNPTSTVDFPKAATIFCSIAEIVTTSDWRCSAILQNVLLAPVRNWR
mmetsp:Transcript_7255/g.15081  ORF Transcript_7255/g.15081 Transcript_7255/m.15081 type:complete len:241 (-) Transcript_7255:1313-2035(-)